MSKMSENSGAILVVGILILIVIGVVFRMIAN